MQYCERFAPSSLPDLSMRPSPSHRRRSRLPSILLLICMPGLASAMGLGELTLHSRIGDPLWAEIALPGAVTRTDCFRLVPGNDDGLPSVHRAELRLAQRNGQWLLQVIQRQALTEPALHLGIHAGCGSQFERHYTLLPAAPDGKPGLPGPLPTAVPPTRQFVAHGPSPAAPGRPQHDQVRSPSGARGDRLELSNETPPLLPEAAWHDDRMANLLRLDQQLSHLQRTTSALDQAIRLGREAAHWRSAIKQANAVIDLPQAAAQQLNTRRQTWRPWLELGGGLLLGGGLSAGLLQTLSPRARSTGKKSIKPDC